MSMYKKSILVIMIVLVILLVAMGIWFFGSSERDLPLLDGQDSVSGNNQINTSSGSTVWYTDDGDTVEDIGLGDEYTSPWFADIDLIAGQRIALEKTGEGSFVRQKYCWMEDEREDKLTFLRDDDGEASKDSPWYMRFVGRKLDESYRIQDFRYDGDDHAHFIIDASDGEELKTQQHRFWIYRDLPELIQVKDESGKVTQYISDALKDNYRVNGCVEG